MQKATEFLDELSHRMKDLLNQSPMRDFEKNARAILTSGLSQLNIVTREEFELQADILKRTRDRLSALEARIAELEAKLKN